MKHLSFIIILACATITVYSFAFSGTSGNTGSEEKTITSENTLLSEEEKAAGNAPKSERNVSPAKDESPRGEASDQDSDNETFDYLEKIVISESYGGISVKYNSASTEVYNKNLGELPESDPFHPANGPQNHGMKVLKTQIDPSGNEYIVVFSEGPSGDPTFYFYEADNPENSAFYLMCLKLYIPGNGSLYVSGHTNNHFNMRKKYQVQNNELVEVEQPFYYVGSKTNMLKPAKLYKTEQLSEVIANLPENYSVEVLVNKPGTNMFLVKTDFGLTGWLQVPNKFLWRGNQMFEDIYIAGD